MNKTLAEALQLLMLALVLLACGLVLPDEAQAAGQRADDTGVRAELALSQAVGKAGQS